MAKRSERPKEPWEIWQKYPEPKTFRSGIKVSWNYYETYEEAEVCAKAARHNAQIQLSQGYDFGYCSPGSIDLQPATAGEYANLYEVCLP